MFYILYGEQYPMIKKRLSRILSERLGTVDEFNVSKFDLDDFEIEDVASDVSMLPLGYERKAVVVDHATFLGGAGNKETREKVLTMLKETSDDVDVIFIHRAGTIDDKSELVKFINEHGEVFVFKNLDKEEWPQYVKKYFKERNVEIDPAAIKELISRVDGDLFKFLNEGAKLCLYKDKISVADVCLMVAKPIEDDVFQISNALIRGDNATAVSIFRDLQLLGSRATDTLIPMLGTQFRFMSQACFLYDKGLDKGQIAKQLGSSEARVAMTLKNARNFSRTQIAHVLDDLYQLDYQIKSGQIDRFYGFELFLINFPN